MESATEKVTKQVQVPCSEKYKCTECCHQGKKEEDVIERIKKNIGKPQHPFPTN